MVQVYITALGNIGHPRIVKVVQMILDDSNDPIEKSKAIFALKNVVVSKEAEQTSSDDSIEVVDRVAKYVYYLFWIINLSFIDTCVLSNN